MTTHIHSKRGKRGRRSRRRQRRLVIGAFATVVPMLLALVFATASADPGVLKRRVAEVLASSEAANEIAGEQSSATERRGSPSGANSALFALDAHAPGMEVPGAGDLSAATDPGDPGAYLQNPPDWSASLGGREGSSGLSRFEGAVPRGGVARASRSALGSSSFGLAPAFFGATAFAGVNDDPGARELATSSLFESEEGSTLVDLELTSDEGDEGRNPDLSGLPEGFEPCPPGGLVVSPCYWPTVDPCPEGGLVVSPCINGATQLVSTPRTLNRPGNGGGFRFLANGGNGGSTSNGGANGGVNGGAGTNGGGNGGLNGGANGGFNGGGNGGTHTPPGDTVPVPAPAPVILIALGLAVLHRRR